ncbi:hypothetical protein BC831DRAFT_446785 [Entophlyctis helioformis]|nr:hypothetical protein BC831DRAFT_446785 [Entophlyctis helioformis]
MLDDIEDIVVDVDSDPAARRSQGSVVVKSFRRQQQQQHNQDSPATAAPAAEPLPSTSSASDHFLPGTASVFVKTWGCGHNNSDGEYMAGLLAADGYNVILEHSRAAEADVWVLNSCTVKGPSEQTFVNDINKGRAAGKKVVVAGCVPQASPSGGEWQGLSIVGVQQIDQVVTVVEEALKGNTVRLLRDAREVNDDGKKRKAGGARLDLPKVRRNPFIEIIPINTGCLNQCTYCKTKHARGDLGSYSPAEIVDRVTSVLSEGVQEIWLTSEDTGAYGKDIGVTIVDLLWAIIAAMEAHPSSPSAMLRVGMTNPPYILQHLDEIARVLAHPRVYAFLHVPVQAGSTRVLTDMRRLYTVEDFERVVDVLRANVPGVTIATDVICGYPTETEQDFDETMRVLEKYRFPVLHISQYYPRPGTPSARLKRIPTDIVKSRSRRATAFFESYTTYDALVGSRQSVLVTEQSADGVHYIGHNKAYHQVLVPKDARLMGRRVTVAIVRSGKHFLVGEVVDGEMARIDAEMAQEAVEAAAGETVLPKRLPKLVRIKRAVHTMSDDAGTDGASVDESASVAETGPGKCCGKCSAESGAAGCGSCACSHVVTAQSAHPALTRADGAELSLGTKRQDVLDHLSSRQAATAAASSAAAVEATTVGASHARESKKHGRSISGWRLAAHASITGMVGLWIWAYQPTPRWTAKLGIIALTLVGTEMALPLARSRR